MRQYELRVVIKDEQGRDINRRIVRNTDFMVLRNVAIRIEHEVKIGLRLAPDEMEIWLVEWRTMPEFSACLKWLDVELIERFYPAHVPVQQQLWAHSL